MASAHASHWRRVGGWLGGSVHALALSPSFAHDRLVLAATGAGIFRSVDGALTWTRASGHVDLPVHAIAFAPDDPRIAFAASHNGRLYRSCDGGESWQEVGTWPAFGVIAALALSPNYANDGMLFAATDNGAFRSLDRGASWQEANFGLLDLDLLCLACAPNFVNNETLWAGSASGGLYRTRNTGRAWREAGSGLADSAVQCIAVSPIHAQDQTLFVGLEEGGVFRSTDGSLSWNCVGLEGRQVNCLALSPGFGTRDAQVMAGTSDGIFVSAESGTNNGASWELVDPASHSVLALAADSGFAIAGMHDAGMLISDDGGRSWRASNHGLFARVPPLVVWSPCGELFALDAAGNIARSSDDGVTWLTCDAGLESAGPHVIAVGGDERMPMILAATSHALLHWDGITETWTPFDAGSPVAAQDSINAMTIAPDRTIVIGTTSGSLHISSNMGASWQALPAPHTGAVLSAQLTCDGAIYALLINPTNEQGFSAEAWHLPAPFGDPNGSWHMIAALDGLQQPFAHMALAESGTESNGGQTVFLAAQDCLATAEPASSEPPRIVTLDAGVAVTALAMLCNAEDDQVLFVGTNKGVFQLEAEENSEALHEEFASLPVVALFDSDNRIGAATLGGEIWQRAARAP